MKRAQPATAGLFGVQGLAPEFGIEPERLAARDFHVAELDLAQAEHRERKRLALHPLEMGRAKLLAMFAAMLFPPTVRFETRRLSSSSISAQPFRVTGAFITKTFATTSALEVERPRSCILQLQVDLLDLHPLFARNLRRHFAEQLFQGGAGDLCRDPSVLGAAGREHPLFADLFRESQQDVLRLQVKFHGSTLQQERRGIDLQVPRANRFVAQVAGLPRPRSLETCAPRDR